MTTQAYQQASQRFLDQAKQELAAGDLPQSSEKGWGATAQILKAVAEQRGWEHSQCLARELLREHDVGRGHRRELGRCAGFAREARDAAGTGLTTSPARVRLAEADGTLFRRPRLL